MVAGEILISHIHKHSGIEISKVASTDCRLPARSTFLYIARLGTIDS